MQWRIFAWFGLSIIVASGVTAIVAFIVHKPPAWVDAERMGEFIGDRFADAWHSDARREQFARELAEDFHLEVVLVDAQGQILYQTASCSDPSMEGAVVLDGEVLGSVRGCPRWDTQRLKSAGFTLGVLLLVLWMASGLIARRVARPIRKVVEVARKLGDGDLKARVDFSSRAFGHEAKVLGDRINEMAARIERQIGDQRELLAVVSHELRTPLGHLRILAEMAEDAKTTDDMLGLYREFNKELDEIEGLVGELLASARLDFANLDLVAVASAKTLVEDALHRAGLEVAVVERGESEPFLADKVVIARALANLISNAEKYAGGVTGAVVATTDDEVCLELHDSGPGMNELAIERAFEPFAREGDKDDLSRPSLGLGLSLVRRIAEAHGGRAYLEARPEGGLIAGIALPLG